MTYEEFQEYVRAKCMYETIYTDSDGREILVIGLLNAYGMVNRAKRTWVGLTDEEIEQGCKESWVTEQAFQSAVWWAEAKLREKNT